jgi:hypothetical protein
MWGVLSDERVDLLFTFPAGPCQSSLFRGPILAELTTIFYCLIWDSSNMEGQVPVFTRISPSRSRSYFMTEGQSVCLGVGHPFGAHDQILLFLLFCRKMALLFVLGRPLWREDGSVICSAICQWSESRSTHDHTLLSHLRLLGSLSVASYDSQELQWRYSNPPPRGETE